MKASTLIVIKKQIHISTFCVNTQWNHRRTHTQTLSLSLAHCFSNSCSFALQLSGLWASSCWPPKLPKICWSARVCEWASGCFFSWTATRKPIILLIFLRKGLKDSLDCNTPTCFCYFDWQMDLRALQRVANFNPSFSSFFFVNSNVKLLLYIVFL